MAFDKSTIENLAGKLGAGLVKAGKSLEELDVGVALTKFEDFKANLGISEKVKAVADYLDSPKMDGVKSAMITVKDFAGFVPNFAQSVPSMIREALGIEDIPAGTYDSAKAPVDEADEEVAKYEEEFKAAAEAAKPADEVAVAEEAAVEESAEKVEPEAESEPAEEKKPEGLKAAEDSVPMKPKKCNKKRTPVVNPVDTADKE